MSTNSNLYKKLLGVGLGSALALSGAFLVAPQEGKVNTTYVDPVGIMTVCYGNTGKEAIKGKIYTDDQCLDQLSIDLKEHDTQMMSYIHVPLTQYQHAAFLSFTYNVGVGSFRSSTLLKKLEAKDYTGACNELPKWNKAGGKVYAGLVKRREAERQICLGNIPKEIVTREIVSKGILHENN